MQDILSLNDRPTGNVNSICFPAHFDVKSTCLSKIYVVIVAITTKTIPIIPKVEVYEK